MHLIMVWRLRSPDNLQSHHTSHGCTWSVALGLLNWGCLRIFMLKSNFLVWLYIGPRLLEWINFNHMPRKVWDKSIYPSPNFTSLSLEWINNFTKHCKIRAITYPCSWLLTADKVFKRISSWWRHIIETPPALLTLCRGNLSITSGSLRKCQ